MRGKRIEPYVITATAWQTGDLLNVSCAYRNLADIQPSATVSWRIWRCYNNVAITRQCYDH